MKISSLENHKTRIDFYLYTTQSIFLSWATLFLFSSASHCHLAHGPSCSRNHKGNQLIFPGTHGEHPREGSSRAGHPTHPFLPQTLVSLEQWQGRNLKDALCGKGKVVTLAWIGSSAGPPLPFQQEQVHAELGGRGTGIRSHFLDRSNSIIQNSLVAEQPVGWKLFPKARRPSLGLLSPFRM